MKNIFPGTFSILVCFLLAFAAQAQREGSIDQKILDGNVAALFDAKNFVSNEGFSSSGVPVPAANIRTGVQKTFTKYFGARSGVNWSQLSKHAYLAQFDLDGRKTNAVFANNGFLVYAVTYGDALHAPKDVRNILRSFYPEHEMSATFQVRYHGQSYDNAWADQTAWIVNLEGENNIVIARVVDGGVDEISNLQKRMEPKRVRKGRVIIPKH